MILKSIFAKAVLATIASANSLTPRLSPGRVQGNDDPVFIDKLGHYLRVGFMNDSSLIGGYTELSENGEDVLRVIRSTDGAKSWKPLGEVFRGDRKTHDINNVFPLQLENGRILYAYRNHDRVESDGHYTWFRISISYSDDGGSSFKYLSTVDERPPRPEGASGLWEPFLRVAKDGSIQCYYSTENNNGDQDGFMKYSKDGGKTWSPFVHVSGGDRVSRDGMIGVAPIDNDGNLMYVLRRVPLQPEDC